MLLPFTLSYLRSQVQMMCAGRCETMLFLCMMKSLLELVEGSAFPTAGLKSLSCCRIAI